MSDYIFYALVCTCLYLNMQYRKNALLYFMNLNKNFRAQETEEVSGVILRSKPVLVLFHFLETQLPFSCRQPECN